jgi:hypothetical protein
MGRGDVVEHQTTSVQVALDELCLDRRLPFEHPVHGGVEILFVSTFKVELVPQGSVVRFGTQASGQGEFGAGRDDASHDHGQHQVPLEASSGCDHPVEAEFAQRPEGSSDVTVRQASLGDEGGLEV